MGGETLGSEKARCPSVGECQDREAGVGGLVSMGSPMEELEKGLKELKGLTSNQTPLSPELPGTKPPTKEYTWRDPWLQPHMWQRMALLDKMKGKALGPVKAPCPSIGECQWE